MLLLKRSIKPRASRPPSVEMNKEIILVNMEEEIRPFLVAFLEKRGFSVIKAKAKELPRLIRDKKPAFVLLESADTTQAKETIEKTAKIKEKPKIILMSRVRISPKEFLLLREAGIDTILDYPVLAQNLIQSLE